MGSGALPSGTNCKVPSGKAPEPSLRRGSVGSGEDDRVGPVAQAAAAAVPVPGR
jgi:hypothetical protein